MKEEEEEEEVKQEEEGSEISKEEGVEDEEEESEEDGGGSGELEENSSSSHNQWSTKLSRTERNKIRKRRMEHRARWREEARRRRLQREGDWSQILPELVAEVDEQIALHEKELEHRQLVREEKQTGTKRLGKYRFRDTPTPILPARRLPRALRHATEHVNLFRDRYLSLQKRNMIAPALPIKLPGRKKKLKGWKKSYVPNSVKRALQE